MTSVQRLDPLDVWFLDAESPSDHQHIAAVAVVEGPAPTLAEFRDLLAGKLRLAPRLRQVVMAVPGGLSRPVWVDDQDFDLDNHLRRTAVPAPGGDAELTTLVSRLVSLEVDRRRPLWDVWVVEGLAEDRWAIVLRAHHAMVDGIAGVDVMAAVFDFDPDATPPPPDDWRPAPPPSGPQLVVDALGDTLRRPVAGLRALTRTARHPARTARHLAELGRGLTDLAGVVRRTDDHGLVGHVGRHRMWTWSEAPLDDVAAIRERHGGTVNDVVLAAVTRGYRDLLVHRRQSPAPGDTLRTAVPVSVRHDDDHDGTGNRVSVMLVDLPVGQPDPVEQLAAISAATVEHKQRHAPQAGSSMLASLDYLPPPLVEAGTRLIAATLQTFVQHNVATITTNVPGPPVPLYVAGRRVVKLLPYVLVGEGITTAVAVFSYCGRLYFGVTGDLDASPDVEVLARGIATGIEELARRT